jgi:transposase
MRKKYPSDVSREQFEKIKPLLEKARKKTKPRIVDLYEVLCGVLYILKSGCQWRMLPSDLPKWQNVYAYFKIWSKKTKKNKSLLEEVLKKINWKGPYQQFSEYQNKLLYN